MYVSRIESQLGGADGLEIRGSVDAAYDRIVQSMFDCLKQMAKLDGEGEDKGQLNYHVILIGGCWPRLSSGFIAFLLMRSTKRKHAPFHF